MGRFSAPSSDDHHDHHPADDNNAADPMDWTIISDDDDEDENKNDENTMLARMQLNNHTTDMMVAYSNNASSSSSSAAAAAVARHHDNISGVSNTASSFAAAAAATNTPNTNINNTATALQIIQQCLQQLQLSNEYYHHHFDNYDEQQQQHLLDRRRRNKKILTFVMLTVLIVCTTVLRWFAPPPPPFSLPTVVLQQQQQQNNENPTMALPLLSFNNNNNGLDHQTTIVAHQTWGEYTTHLFQLTSSAILYMTSVLWYVISNSFRYAVLDVWDKLDNFWFANGGGRWLVSSSSSSSFATDYDEYDGKKNNVIQVNREAVCPIRIQAVCNYQTLLPRGVAAVRNNNDNERSMEGLSTEESLRQHHHHHHHQQHQQQWQQQRQGVMSLPSQNMALQIIARGIDSWGESMVEEITSSTSTSVEVIHRMASFMMMMRTGHRDSLVVSASSSSSSSLSNGDSGSDKENDVGVTLKEWILPPAKGFLFIGPAGVGKLHVARHVADWFFAHCNSNSNNSNNNKSGSSSDKSCTDDDDNNEMKSPVLQIIAGDDHADDDVTTRRSIIQHIQRRKGLGSVIIIHHIEQLDDNGLLSDIIKVLNGNTNTIPYSNDVNDGKNQEVSCDGTIFLLTSEQWGTKRIFQMIQRNEGLNYLSMMTGLLSGIRREVNSHLNYWQVRFNSHTTIVPFLPFQQDDMFFVMQGWFQELSDRYRDVHWARLDVSTSALEHSVGIDHVDYLDLYHAGNFQPTKTTKNGDNEDDKSQQLSLKPLITFSTNGAHALHENSVYTALTSKLKRGTRRRPNKTALIDVDEDTFEYVLSWCDPDYVDVHECEAEWRLSF